MFSGVFGTLAAAKRQWVGDGSPPLSLSLIFLLFLLFLHLPDFFEYPHRFFEQPRGAAAPSTSATTGSPKTYIGSIRKFQGDEEKEAGVSPKQEKEAEEEGLLFLLFLLLPAAPRNEIVVPMTSVSTLAPS